MKHRIILSARNWYGALLWSQAIDTFGERRDAERTAREYKQALRADYGLFSFVSAKVESTEWSGEHA